LKVEGRKGGVAQGDPSGVGLESRGLYEVRGKFLDL